jgi:hypothetical protein
MPSELIDQEFAEGILGALTSMRLALDHLERAVRSGLPPQPRPLRLIAAAVDADEDRGA